MARVYQSNYQCRYYGRSEKGVCDSTVMSKRKDIATNVRDDVNIRRLGGESHGDRGQRRGAVESRASKNRAGQEMGQGFQAIQWNPR